MKTQCAAALRQRLAELNVSTNPAPEAVFLDLGTQVHLYANGANQPPGWLQVPMSSGVWPQPCAQVGTFRFEHKDPLDPGSPLIGLFLETHHPADTAGQNLPDDLLWALRQVRALFKQARVKLPPITITGGWGREPGLFADNWQAWAGERRQIAYGDHWNVTGRLRWFPDTGELVVAATLADIYIRLAVIPSRKQVEHLLTGWNLPGSAIYGNIQALTARLRAGQP